MKAYVCLKHVLDTAASIKIIGDKKINETVKYIIRPQADPVMGGPEDADQWSPQSLLTCAQKLSAPVPSVGRPAGTTGAGSFSYKPTTI